MKWSCRGDCYELGGRLCMGWLLSNFEMLCERPHCVEGLITERKNPEADLRLEPTCLAQRNEIGWRYLECDRASAPMALPCLKANVVSEEDHIHTIATRETPSSGWIRKENRCRIAFHIV